MKRVALIAAVTLLIATIQGCGQQEPKSPADAAKNSATAAADKTTGEIVCSLAPSQNAVVSGISGAAGGGSAATLALAQALGLTVVTHSSGAYILTGAGGYLAGTLGAAITGPIIVVAGLTVGGAAVAVELLCAPKNHPGAVAKIDAAAEEFWRRSRDVLKQAPSVIADAGNKSVVVAKETTVQLKQVAGDVYAYAYGGK